jgi:hypothetical protein
MAKSKGPSTPGSAPAATVSKADAVRAALKAGVAKPTEAVAYIKETFGLDISAAMVSTYKGNEKKRAGKRRRRGRPANAWVNANTGGSSGDVVDLVRQVRGLVDRYGAAQVKQIVGVFER